jgi:hypothetical protein
VQKKLGDEWKKKVLAPAAGVRREGFFYLVPDGTARVWDIPLPPQPPAPPLTKRAVPPAPPAPPAPPVVKPLPPQPPTPPARPALVDPLGTAPVVRPLNVPVPPQADRLEKLVGELIAAKKSDEALLEAVTLATLSRLPTDSEKKLVLASIGTAADRKAAWVSVAKALAGPTDVLKPATRVKVIVDPAAPPAPPVPPAKP